MPTPSAALTECELLARAAITSELVDPAPVVVSMSAREWGQSALRTRLWIVSSVTVVLTLAHHLFVLGVHRLLGHEHLLRRHLPLALAGVSALRGIVRLTGFVRHHSPQFRALLTGLRFRLSPQIGTLNRHPFVFSFRVAVIDLLRRLHELGDAVLLFLHHGRAENRDQVELPPLRHAIAAGAGRGGVSHPSPFLRHMPVRTGVLVPHR